MYFYIAIFDLPGWSEFVVFASLFPAGNVIQSEMAQQEHKAVVAHCCRVHCARLWAPQFLKASNCYNQTFYYCNHHFDICR